MCLLSVLFFVLAQQNRQKNQAKDSKEVDEAEGIFFLFRTPC